MKSSLHSPNPFLPFLLNHFRLPTLLVLCCNCQLRRLNRHLILAAWDPRYIVSVWTGRKHHFLYCCMLIHCCRNVFTAQLRSNKRGADPQRPPLLLLRDVTAMWRVPLRRVYGPLHSNGCFSASTAIALSKYTILFSYDFCYFCYLTFRSVPINNYFGNACLFTWVP
jgi:hypothetical protein